MLTGYQRLQRLRKVLENVQVAKAKFDMALYFTDEEGEEDFCGTPSCAAGWAAVDRVLKREGLTRRMVVDTYKMSDFFGLEDETSDEIFMPASYGNEYRDDNGKITPAGVIKRIDELLAGHAQRP